MEYAWNRTCELCLRRNYRRIVSTIFLYNATIDNIHRYIHIYSNSPCPAIVVATNDFARLKLISNYLQLSPRQFWIAGFYLGNVSNGKQQFETRDSTRLRQLEATGTISREQQLPPWKDPRDGKPPSPATTIDQEQTSRLRIGAISTVR